MSQSKEKKAVYLHIGFFKTGSTVIQNFLVGNRELLCEMGYFYPDLGSHDHFCIPAKMAQEINSPVPPKFMLEPCKLSSDELWEKVIDEFESSGADNLIISTETFSDFSFSKKNSKLVKEVHTKLSDYNTKIILYLREHIPYIRSMYQEVVKIQNEYVTENEFIIKHADGWHMNYSLTLKYWSGVFGKDKLIVDRYPGKGSNPQDLLVDFLGKTGLEWSNKFKLPAKYVSNIGITKEWVEAKRIFNMLESAKMPIQRLMNDMSTPYELTAESIDYINNIIVSDVGLINDKYNIQSRLDITSLSLKENTSGGLNYDSVYSKSALLLLGRLLTGTKK